MMRTIFLTIGSDWVDLKKLSNYQSGDILVFNQHLSTNALMVESDIKPTKPEGIILSGYGQSRSAFSIPANSGNIWVRSEDLSIQIAVQTQ